MVQFGGVKPDGLERFLRECGQNVVSLHSYVGAITRTTTA